MILMLVVVACWMAFSPETAGAWQMRTHCIPHRTGGRPSINPSPSLVEDTSLLISDLRVDQGTYSSSAGFSSLQLGATTATSSNLQEERVDSQYYFPAGNPPPDSRVSLSFVLSKNCRDRASKFGRSSPVDCPSVLDAAVHLCRKIRFFSKDQIDCQICILPDNIESFDTKELESTEVVVALGLDDPSQLAWVSKLFQNRLEDRKASQAQIALDCSESTEVPLTTTKVGTYTYTKNIAEAPFLKSIAAKLFPWTTVGAGKRFAEKMEGLFDRWTSDDFTVAWMLFFHRFTDVDIPWVATSADATWEKGPVQNAKEFAAMATKCGDRVLECLQDEKCKACLETLTALDTRDQAASYRAIVSYESDKLRDMSYCIFQKHNIFQCKAEIPAIPKVEPLSVWRGQPLTKEVARSLLVGHLEGKELQEICLSENPGKVSWKVACGANVAYDQFPSQNQLFYPASSGKDMWYDPVFRVETLDGRHVWCSRHYKVRDGPNVGTFRLSVLDNGVTSNEFWTIVGAADDLSWIVFHYAGAAKSVGQHYLGGLLCTPDGSLPSDPTVLSKIWTTFQSAGIEPWELFVVDNDPNSHGLIAAGPPPLDTYRSEVLAAIAKKQQATTAAA